MAGLLELAPGRHTFTWILLLDTMGLYVNKIFFPGG